MYPTPDISDAGASRPAASSVNRLDLTTPWTRPAQPVVNIRLLDLVKLLARQAAAEFLPPGGHVVAAVVSGAGA